LSTKLHEGNDERNAPFLILRFAQNDEASVAFPFRRELQDTSTRRNKNPRPAESVAVCGGKLQSKGLGFGAERWMPLGFTRLHAPKPMARGVAIEARVPIPQVLWLLSPKESNNKKDPHQHVHE
jgi:hypothetical protein